MTELREKIFNIIKNSDNPLTAKCIFDKIDQKPDLSSVYRSLHFLEDNHYINTVSFSGIRFYHGKSHGHFLICKECNKIITFDECIAANLQNEITQKYDYEITNHVLYFEGICPHCKNTKN